MAQDGNDPEIDVVEGYEDNAKHLTNGLVYATTVVLVLAFVVMQFALGKWFKMGMAA